MHRHAALIQSKSEDIESCRWQAALRIVLSALTADVTAYIGSLAPPDAAAAPSSTAATQAVGSR